MTVIAGTLEETHQGRFKYELINDKGEELVLSFISLYMPSIKYILFSPHQYIVDKVKNSGASLTLKSQGAILFLKKSNSIQIKYASNTMLPILHSFDNAIYSTKYLALTGWITDKNNQNLSYMRKWLLIAHQRMGNIYFQHLKWI